MAVSAQERGWKGLLTNASPHDLPAGFALAQNNLIIVAGGVLRVRRGLIPLAWTSVTPADSVAVTSIARFDIPTASYLCYGRADGSVKAAYNGGLSSILTGLLPGYPISFARSRQGYLYMANGMNSVQRWNGIATTAGVSGIAAPTSAPTVSFSATGSLSVGTYQWAYRWVDSEGYASPLSVIVSGVPAANQHAVVTAYYTNQAHGNLNNALSGPQSTVEIWRTTVGEDSVFYRVDTEANSNSTGSFTFSDATSDATLFNNAVQNPALAMTVYAPTGAVIARRQAVPPSTKPFIAAFQDRLWMYGRATYSTGTVTLTNSSAVITGVGTAWPSSFVGRYIRIQGETSDHQIGAWSSTTSLTLSNYNAPGNNSGLTYTIYPAPSERRLLYVSAQDEFESVPVTYAVTVQENTGDDDPETGLMPLNATMYLLHQRHIYRATFVPQGQISITVQLACYRGCVNNRCWTVTNESAYLLDQSGAYSFDGSSPKPLSDRIQDLWINGTLDFTKSAYWFADWEPVEQVVRFYVNYTGDSGNYPTRALVYSTISNSWSTETYAFGVGASCRTDYNGDSRQVIGGTADNLFLAYEGLTDVVTSLITGTATGGASGTLIDSNTSFAGSVGAPIAILSGSGAGQSGVIASLSNSNHTATLTANWTVPTGGTLTSPDATSVYAIGAIGYQYQTGRHQFAAGNQDVAQIRRAVLNHPSTTNAAVVNVRQYLNHDAVPQVWEGTMSRLDGVRYEAGNPNAIVNLKATQFSAGTDPGYKAVNFHGVATGPMSAKWIMLELLGFQTLDAISFYSLDLEGIQ